MVRYIRFKKDWRCFKEGEQFDFRKGVNLLVGDQGTGKSSLYQLILGSAGSKGSSLSREFVQEHVTIGTFNPGEKRTLFSFDFENDNPRVVDFNTSFLPTDIVVLSRYLSHGQVINMFLKRINEMNNCIYLADEVDMGLSIRSAMKLGRIFKEASKKECQIIVVSHSQTLIESQDEVLSLEHKRWIRSSEFVELSKEK